MEGFQTPQCSTQTRARSHFGVSGKFEEAQLETGMIDRDDVVQACLTGSRC